MKLQQLPGGASWAISLPLSLPRSNFSLSFGSID